MGKSRLNTKNKVRSRERKKETEERIFILLSSFITHKTFCIFKGTVYSNTVDLNMHLDLSI